MRNGAKPKTLLEKTDITQVMQLMHAEGMSNGIRYQWAMPMEPSQDLIDEFEKLANQELPQI